MTRKAMQELAKTYEEAGRLAAAQVRKAVLAGNAELTIGSWAQIERQLRLSAYDIREGIETQVFKTVNMATRKTNIINEKYLFDAIDFQQAGQPLTKSGIENLFISVNKDVIQSMVNRVWQNGYTFDARIWESALDYQNQIKRVVSSGLAQGRDVVKIAKDIQIYIKDGKTKLVKRYGELKRGTSAFVRRIGDKVDWRALRVVRSELYASLQEASVRQGLVNPAVMDKYEWVLNSGRQHWGCACPDNQAGSPYKYSEIPGYPHPNCQCQIRPVLMDSNEFKSDLKSWVNGESVGYIDQWYFNQYSTS